MPNPYSLFATDQRKESEGVWLEFDGFALKIARAGGANRAYLRTLERKLAPHRQQLLAGSLAPEEDRRILVETFAEAVLLDWRDVTDREGTPLPFSAENATRLLGDLPELFAIVQQQAGDFARFKEEERAATTKN